MLTTSALRDYMYLVCISIKCRLLVTMGESPDVTDDCRMDLSGLQSAIKMIRLLLYVCRRDVMTQK